MKRRIFCTVTPTLLAICLLCASCTAKTEPEPISDPVSETASDTTPDTQKPRIGITNPTVVIKKGEGTDLMKGITGKDDKDGVITDKIQIETGGYDPQKAGTYTVTYTLSDSAGNQADPKIRTVIVRETDALEKAPVWTGEIVGEKRDPTPPRVFNGAWYHKVVSSKDQWVGIEATVILPEFDINRYSGEYDDSLPADPNVKNLDNPSVYFGGNALTEADVGLSLKQVLIDGKVSTGSVAFRPFWRYITTEDQDVGGYDEHYGEYAVTATGNNCAANYHYRYTEYYYLPGDELRVIVYSPEPNKLQLQIEVIAKSTLPSSVSMREKYGWKDPENFISPIFTSPGQGTGIDAEFKRVNAIDQSGNEGKPTISTTSEVKEAVWKETYLYRVIDGTLYRVPMDEHRKATTDAPKAGGFTVSYDGVDPSLGGEVVSIHPKDAG